MTLDLDDDDNSIQKTIENSVLLVENMTELSITKFQVGLRNDDLKGFSSFIFKNVTFSDLPSAGFALENYNLAVFDRIIIRDEKFRLTADNSDSYTDPDVWIVNSVFPSYESLLNRKSELEIELLDQPAFSLSVINEQRAKPTSKNRNPCNYDYKGSVILKNNQLGVLAKKKIEVIGAHQLTMEGNVFDVAESTDDDKAIDIHNVREVVVLNNRFDLLLDPEKPIFYFKYERDTGRCDEPSLPYTAIDLFDFANNRFLRQPKTVFELDWDQSYEDDFSSPEKHDDWAAKFFSVSNNTIDRPCDCTPSKELGKNPRLEELLKHEAQKGSRCLSPQNPPLMGKRKDICNGVYPVPHGKRTGALVAGIRGSWTVYLIIAVLITALLTAIIAVLATRYFCAGNGNDKRSVSPAGLEAPHQHHPPPQRFDPN